MKREIQMMTRLFALVTLCFLAVPHQAWSMDVATVNGKAVTDKDMEDSLGGLNEGQRHGLLRDYNARRQVLNGLIDQELLDQEAKKEKLDQDDAFKSALENFKRQYLASQVLRKNLSGKVTEAAAKRFYEANKVRYSTEQVHAQHILVTDEAKAMEILKEAQQPNADFQALAEKYSKDPSVKNNRGDIGFFGRAGQMVPEFTNAAFAGKEGEIIGPVRTSYGYHIIKIVERKPGKVLEYSDVEGRVMTDLQAETTQKYMSNLRKEAKVSVDEKALQKMKD
jgi:parvulin-like peptidyl-prolyl isomerase